MGAFIVNGRYINKNYYNMMDITKLYLSTPFASLPSIINNNFQRVGNYLNLFYDPSNGVIVVPVQTTGRIKATRGEFTTVVVDNLTVRSQYTNLFNNITTIDNDYYTTYIQGATNVRPANPSTFENQRFKYIDVNKPYYKITNDSSIAFSTTNLGQQIQLLFDVSTVGKPFNILLDPSNGGTFKTLNITASDSSAAWSVLIAVNFDSSWGTTWAIKEYGGNYHIV